MYEFKKINFYVYIMNSGAIRGHPSSKKKLKFKVDFEMYICVSNVFVKI